MLGSGRVGPVRFIVLNDSAGPKMVKQIYISLKKSEKIEIHFYNPLGLAESFKMINQPDQNAVDGLFLGKYKR